MLISNRSANKSSSLQQKSSAEGLPPVAKLPIPPSTPTPFIESWMAKRKAEEDMRSLSEDSFMKKHKLKEEELRKKLEFGKVQKAKAYDALIAAKKTGV
jgi:hypothetical protein